MTKKTKPTSIAKPPPQKKRLQKPQDPVITRADQYEAMMVANLVVIAQVYADGMGWSLATVSKQIHGNQSFFAKFSAGEVSTSIKTYFLMVDKFKENWPHPTPWPKTMTIPELGKNIAN